MSSTGSNKESTFNSAAVNNINPDNIGQPTSASIIASMSNISGCDIKSASLVVDGFWDYIENRNEHWRKDTNTLTIPNFGTFTIKPFYNGKIKKKKIGIIKFIGSEFIYRNKKGQWNKPQIQKLQISFSLKTEKVLEPCVQNLIPNGRRTGKAKVSHIYRLKEKYVFIYTKNLMFH